MCLQYAFGHLYGPKHSINSILAFELLIIAYVGTNGAAEQSLRVLPGGVFGPVGEQPSRQGAVRGVGEKRLFRRGDDDAGKLVVILEQGDTTFLHDKGHLQILL